MKNIKASYDLDINCKCGNKIKIHSNWVGKEINSQKYVCSKCKVTYTFFAKP